MKNIYCHRCQRHRRRTVVGSYAEMILEVKYHKIHSLFIPHGVNAKGIRTYSITTYRASSIVSGDQLLFDRYPIACDGKYVANICVTK